MTRTLTSAAALALLCGAAFAQAPPAGPEFEAAVIKLNKSGQNDAAFDMLPSGLFSARNVPLSEVFRFAFKVRRENLVGTPGWINTDRVDITGRAPAGTPDETLRIMARSFLIQEFKLVTHEEQRTLPAFTLVVTKGGPKLSKAAGPGEPVCKPVPALAPETGNVHRGCTNMTLSQLADALTFDLAPGYIDRTVVDQTGLNGAYDFRLDWAGVRFINTLGGVNIFGALERLGLKLEEERLSLPVVIIDHVEQLAEN